MAQDVRCSQEEGLDISFTVGAKLALVALILLSILVLCCLSKVEDYYDPARELDWELRMVVKGWVLFFKMGEG